MKAAHIYATLSAVSLVGLLLSPAAVTSASAAPAGFVTGTAPYITVADPGSASVQAIITSGDSIGDYTFANIPDGIGAYDEGSKL